MKEEKWCSKQHEDKNTKFDIFEMSDAVRKTIDEYTERDFDIEDVKDPRRRRKIVREFDFINDCARDIGSYSRAANVIYIDDDESYSQRKSWWNLAKGSCAKLRGEFKHIAEYVDKDTNVQKYVDMNDDIIKIETKITNVMKSDHRRFTQKNTLKQKEAKKQREAQKEK